MDLRHLAVFLQLIFTCWSDVSKSAEKELEKEEKFEYKRKEPANELGIFSTVIAHVHRKANQTTEEWRLNRAYLPDDVYESLVSRCKSDPEGGPIRWSGCVSDEEGLFAHVTWGVPEPKNKTIVYLELHFNPFARVNEKGEEEVCVLEEVYKTRAYVVLNTFSEVPSNDSFPRGVVESVASVHQHQLDSFGENFLSIFEDKIDRKYIYNFGKDEYYDRDPPYECFLSLASSESKSVIENKCDFYCPNVKRIPAEELEELLKHAKQVADEEERAEAEDDDSDSDSDTLTDTNHEEL